MAKVLGHDIRVMDGGMGRELYKKNPNIEDFQILWSAAFLLYQPETVIKSHEDFIRSGAEIIITNNYAAIPSFLNGKKMVHKMYDLIKLAGELAQTAKTNSGKHDLVIAGSIPPFNFSYDGSKILDPAPLIADYTRVATTLSPYVDVFICETLSGYDEAVTALHGLKKARDEGAISNQPIWVSFCIKEYTDNKSKLYSGEDLSTVANAVLNEFPDMITGLFLNCAPPEIITQSLPTLIEAGNQHGIKVLGAYANNFVNLTDDEIEKRRNCIYEDRKLAELPLDEYNEYAKKWYSMGCTIVGGCCGIGPEYIGKIASNKPKLS